MADPKVGDRRPREGRCERCDRPLTDVAWTTWTPLLPADAAPVTDWREGDSTDTHCAGDPFCDAPEVDWKARALAAEAEVADLRSRAHLVETAARKVVASRHDDLDTGSVNWVAVLDSHLTTLAAALAAADGDDHE